MTERPLARSPLSAIAREDAPRARGSTSTVPRLAFRLGEAAEALGVSPDFFAAHIAGDLRWVRRGAVRLVARSELEAWLERAGERTLEEEP
jgi:excisionase family DNA binding protein